MFYLFLDETMTYSCAIFKVIIRIISVNRYVDRPCTIAIVYCILSFHYLLYTVI